MDHFQPEEAIEPGTNIQGNSSFDSNSSISFEEGDRAPSRPMQVLVVHKQIRQARDLCLYTRQEDEGRMKKF